MRPLYLFRRNTKLPYRYYLREDHDHDTVERTIVLNEEDFNFIVDNFKEVKDVHLTSYTCFSKEELKSVINNVQDQKDNSVSELDCLLLSRLVSELNQIYENGNGVILDSNL